MSRWSAATVERIEYDPNRTAFIALIKYEDGELSYILAPNRLAPGDQVIAGERVDTKPGNAMLLSQMSACSPISLSIFGFVPPIRIGIRPLTGFGQKGASSSV